MFEVSTCLTTIHLSKKYKIKSEPIINMVFLLKMKFFELFIWPNDNLSFTLQL